MSILEVEIVSILKAQIGKLSLGHFIEFVRFRIHGIKKDAFGDVEATEYFKESYLVREESSEPDRSPSLELRVINELFKMKVLNKPVLNAITASLPALPQSSCTRRGLPWMK